MGIDELWGSMMGSNWRCHRPQQQKRLYRQLARWKKTNGGMQNSQTIWPTYRVHDISHRQREEEETIGQCCANGSSRMSPRDCGIG